MVCSEWSGLRIESERWLLEQSFIHSSSQGNLERFVWEFLWVVESREILWVERISLEIFVWEFSLGCGVQRNSLDKRIFGNVCLRISLGLGSLEKF